jgi:hypothetical protein
MEPKGDKEPLHDVIGKARYPADRTRPDILLALSLLGSNMTEPSAVHETEVLRLLKYLLGTISLNLEFGGSIIDPFYFCDASLNLEGDSHSQYGYCGFLNEFSGAFDTKCARNTTIDDSVNSAELKALFEATKSAIWLTNILNELGLSLQKPIPIYMDNLGAKAIAEVYQNLWRNRHLNMRINFIREQIAAGIITVHHVDTEDNIADLLTKPLPGPRMKRLREPLLKGLKKAKFVFKSSINKSLHQRR